MTVSSPQWKAFGDYEWFLTEFAGIYQGRLIGILSMDASGMEYGLMMAGKKQAEVEVEHIKKIPRH